MFNVALFNCLMNEALTPNRYLYKDFHVSHVELSYCIIIYILRLLKSVPVINVFVSGNEIKKDLSEEKKLSCFVKKRNLSLLNTQL